MTGAPPPPESVDGPPGVAPGSGRGDRPPAAPGAGRGDGPPAAPGRVDLLLDAAHEPPALRADAARNRTRLLEAAAGLMSECGAPGLTMEAVAAAAGVGKGTVFRRFGDRAGLFIALVDHQERQLQAAFLSGPAPLGPDAPARERLLAFGPAVLRHERGQQALILAARTDPMRKYLVPAHRLRAAHVAMLLHEAGATGDVELQAHTLLASLDTSLVRYLTEERGMPPDRLEASWRELVTRLLP